MWNYLRAIQVGAMLFGALAGHAEAVSRQNDITEINRFLRPGFYVAVQRQYPSGVHRGWRFYISELIPGGPHRAYSAECSEGKVEDFMGSGIKIPFTERETKSNISRREVAQLLRAARKSGIDKYRGKAWHIVNGKANPIRTIEPVDAEQSKNPTHILERVYFNDGTQSQNTTLHFTYPASQYRRGGPPGIRRLSNTLQEVMPQHVGLCEGPNFETPKTIL